MSRMNGFAEQTINAPLNIVVVQSIRIYALAIHVYVACSVNGIGQQAPEHHQNNE